MNILPYVIAETGVNPVGTVIWLHGLGADGHDFESIVPELNLPTNLPIRFIFPHAPVIPVTVNGGVFMPAWYDIMAIEIEREIDEEGVSRSVEEIEKIIEAENEKGVSNENIILAGFSQGGAVVSSLLAGSGKNFGGLMALSTYMPMWPSVEPTVNTKTPVFIGHGSEDPVVPMELGRKLEEYFENWGYKVDFNEYPMEHSIHPNEIKDIREFLISCFVK